MLVRNNVYHGDCLELMIDIPDKSIDMILCDLPYGTTACRWDSVIPFEILWEHYKRIIKDNGAIALFGSEPFSSLLRCSNLGMYKYDWIWKKNKSSNFINAKYQPLKNYETVSIFSKKASTYSIKGNMFYNPQGVIELKASKIQTRKGIKKGEIYHSNPNIETLQKYSNYPTCIIELPMVTKPLHPTQKPVELCEYFIKTYTNEGDVVLDNCCGSGSTVIAAINTNRGYIAMEKEEEYYLLTKNRIKKHMEGLNE